MTNDTTSYAKIYNPTPEDNQHVTKKKKTRRTMRSIHEDLVEILFKHHTCLLLQVSGRKRNQICASMCKQGKK